MVESLRFVSASLVGPLFNSLENNVSRTLRVTIITHLKQQFHPELKSPPFEPHPLFASFIQAAMAQSRLV